jgi:hypothetical protein
MKIIKFKGIFFLIFLINVNLIFGINFDLVGVDYEKDIILFNFSKNHSKVDNLSFNFADESKKIEKLFFKNEKNSSFLLLMSKKEFFNFSKRNDYVRNNCFILINNKTNLGYYGLKKNEDFEILDYNFSTIFSSKNYSKKTLNLSVCFNLINISTIKNISNSSNNILINKTSLNQTNILNYSNLSLNISDKINYGFKIVSKEIYENKPIKFSFLVNNSNITDFIISYSIENLNKKIVKPIRNTSNFNEKSFSPKESNIYFIIAKLFVNGIEKNISKKKIYYFSKSEKNKIETIRENEIVIINNNTIIKDKKIILKIFRNETNKRTVNLYLNSKKVLTIESNKNSEIQLVYHFKENELKELKSLKIMGLGVSKEIKFNFSQEESNNTLNLVSNLKNQTQKENKKTSIENLSLLNISNSNIYFNVKLLNQEIKNFSCYVLNKKTLISKRIIFSNVSNINYNLSLEINSSILKNNFSNLRIICKYVKKNQVSKKYLSKNFNFTKMQTELLNNNIINSFNWNYSQNIFNITDNDSKILDLKKLNFTNLNKTKYNLKLSQLNLNLIENQKNLQMKQELIFKGKEELLKDNSINFILGGISFLGLILLVFW